MTQSDIADILVEHYPTYLSYEEIVEITGLGKSTVIQTLRRLRKRNEIQFKIVWGNKLQSRWCYLYRSRD